MTFDEFDALEDALSRPALVPLPDTSPSTGGELARWREADPDGHSLLDELEADIDAESVDCLQREARAKVIGTLATAFGLGPIVSRLDHDGGNVLTLRNARQGGDGLAEQSKLHDFQRRQQDRRYDTTLEQRDAAWTRAGGSNDEYTGQPLTGSAEVDHVVSCKELKDDGAADFYMDEQTAWETATHPDNLRVTSKSNNASKGGRNATEWAQDRDGVDPERVAHADRVARRTLRRRLAAAKAWDRGKRVAVTGVAEGAKMGFQQMVGVVVAELVNGCFDEVGALLHERRSGRSRGLVRELKTRGARVLRRVLARWKDALAAFRDGAISGFFSNLVTFLINQVWRTGKNVVRAIREGVFGLGRALQVLFAKGARSTEEALHEASKVLVASGLVVGGVFVEEAVQNAMAGSGLLLPLAPFVAPVVAGLLSGLAAVLASWLLDKLDVFGAFADRRDEALHARLDLLLA